MVTSRAGTFTITTPVRPRESVTRIIRSPSAVVASERGRSTEADQLPPLSTSTVVAATDAIPLYHFTTNGHLRYLIVIILVVSNGDYCARS